MATSASTSKPADKAAKTDEEEKTQDDQHHLGVLEEDDEFEEFPVAGSWPPHDLKFQSERT
jgi:26 proteasome complex subunit DSS1